MMMQSTGQGATHSSQPVHSEAMTVCEFYHAEWHRPTGRDTFGAADTVFFNNKAFFRFVLAEPGSSGLGATPNKLPGRVSLRHRPADIG
jgi:hypothetical protein